MRFLSRIHKIEKMASGIPTAESMAARARVAAMSDSELIEIVRTIPANLPPLNLTKEQIERLIKNHESKEVVHAM